MRKAVVVVCTVLLLCISHIHAHAAQNTDNFTAEPHAANDTITHEHTWNSGEITKEPTCTEKGIKTFSCALDGCKVTYTEYIPALGHSGGTASCRAYAKCEICGEEYGEFDIYNHINIATVDAVAATCTQLGKTEGKCCSDCGYYVVTQKSTAKLPHAEQIIPAMLATCTKLGFSEGKSCSVCGQIIIEQKEISSLGHEFTDFVGSFKCTCNANKYDIYKCIRCNETTIRNTAITTAIIISAVPATCTQSGLSDGKKCSVCQDIVIAQKLIPPLGHNFTEYIASVEPTCTKNGYILYKCVRCDEKEKKEIPKTEHSYVSVITLPTCIEGGYTTHTCTVCGDSYKDSAKPPLGHEYDITWTVDKPATATTVGEKSHHCRRCNTRGYITQIPVLETPQIEINGNSELKLPGEGEYIYAVAKQTVSDILFATTENAEVLTQNGTTASLEQELVNGMKIVLKDSNGNTVDERIIIVLGDVDSDGKITAADARLALRASVGLEKLNEWQTLAANVDDNPTVISAADARLILRASVGLETL